MNLLLPTLSLIYYQYTITQISISIIYPLHPINKITPVKIYSSLATFAISHFAKNKFALKKKSYYKNQNFTFHFKICFKISISFFIKGNGKISVVENFTKNDLTTAQKLSCASIWRRKIKNKKGMISFHYRCRNSLRKSMTPIEIDQI